MVDIHSHILAGVDDGPDTIDAALVLLKKAASEGLTDLIATSHAYSPHYHVPKAVVLEQLDQLRRAAAEAGIDIQLHQGQEIRIHEHIVQHIEAGEALSLAESKYVLLELPSSTIPAYTIPVIQGLLMSNHVPIIAHPERNRAIAEKPSRLKNLIKNGALAQVTAGSVAGHFGKGVQKLSMQLIEANLIQTYGSDVHNDTTRPALFNKGLDYLDKAGYAEYVDIYLENNARILSNDELIILEPQKVQVRKWWQLIG